jgi:hypothetical protein
MLLGNEVAAYLGYTDRDNWVGAESSDQTKSHLLRHAHKRQRAHKQDVVGTYSFRTSPEHYPLLPRKSAVHVAQAETLDEAREIHRKLWNLGDAPFLIIVLPYEVRVYTGFEYDAAKDRPLKTISGEITLERIKEGLSEFRADEIDSGRIWATWGKKLPLASRVDQHLLANLQVLGHILIHDKELKPEVAHSLIGKYIYIRYLQDRGILSPQWLEEKRIDIDTVLGRYATVTGLKSLVDALEERFRGRVFPLPLDGQNAPQDADVAYVASVFKGDSAHGQLSLDFQIYDFSYIPIELLSSIYEQFLRARGEAHGAGAYYTPEPLAEYLLSEVNAVRPLHPGLKILDPCCGSGVFLVLAYRRLVEIELRSRPDGKLRPIEVRQILIDSIYGVERNLEACYVTEFSLLLTMLSYIDPPELHRNEDFEFPNLHNKNIFHQDFFDGSGEIWRSEFTFDWIIGNPPWVEIKSATEEDKFARSWMKANARLRPTARGRVCEAFTWQVVDLLADGGYVGLIVHAKSLTNDQSRRYRKEFFKAHYVPKVTNFSNLAYVLFDSRAQAPAATLIYTKRDLFSPGRTIHYGPFVVNQLPIRTQRNKRSWTITVYDGEISVLEYDAITSGDAEIWKMALWGSSKDQKTLSRLRRLFPNTITKLAAQRGWHFGLGVQLRTDRDLRKGVVKRCAELEGTSVLDSKLLNKLGARFIVPPEAIVPNAQHNVRKQGGLIGLRLIPAPHLVISASYAVFSDTDFVLQHPRVGISAGRQDADYLRALSVYLNSGIAKYMAFFVSSQWGVDRTTFGHTDVGDIPVPDLSPEQIAALVDLHAACVQEDYNREREVSDLPALTRRVGEILCLPESIANVVSDFVSIKLQTNKGKTRTEASRTPTETELLAYGGVLKEQLDGFARIRHSIAFRMARDFFVCEIDSRVAAGADDTPKITKRGAVGAEEDIWRLLRHHQTQWIYVQRSLRIFDGSKLYLYKPRRVLDWTRTQAMLDAEDVIAEVLNGAAPRSME